MPVSFPKGGGEPVAVVGPWDGSGDPTEYLVVSGPLVQAVEVVALRRLWSDDTARPGDRSRLRREDPVCGRSRWKQRRPSLRGGWPRGYRNGHKLWCRLFVCLLCGRRSFSGHPLKMRTLWESRVESSRRRMGR